MVQSYVLDDPRPIAASAPYTYFLPSAARLAAIEPGDQVKLLFRSLAASPKYDVERMWVCVLAVDGEHFEGTLENAPFDMPGLKKGERVSFERFHVVSIDFQDAAKEDRIGDEPGRQYWDRCMVDRCVLYEGVPVGYLYREDDLLEREGDKYPDSGWRIRGDARGLSDAEVDSREAEYVALGTVLNRDDSWLPLIDEPKGSAFLRNFTTNTYDKQ
ncbi:MAG TPA: DUF2185 domain-containing protein [Vitreimonas sp.]|uniref:immunity protein Imm33 domain-containing protein n=1 Tax=Vitreimonas sp. TaxID=3069702 RepID=UPI002D6AC3F6|nr:DUF2185 domain-containing protein [Vitreimonas sp.]HYD88532.1 DUF2185 domain-containing protein [Vitreimonas sp.]